MSTEDQGAELGDVVVSAEVQARAATARGALRARSLGEVSAHAKWWGFEIHMDSTAANNLAEITDLVANIIDEVVPNIGKLLALLLKVRAIWIKAVDRGYGVKCVSPWIMPAALIASSLVPSEDTSLWWTVYEGASGWSEDQKFLGHYSGSNPALVEFNGRLILVHRGYSDRDNNLWWAEYDADTGWSEDHPFPAHGTSAGPALAVFGGKLHCVHKASNDDHLWHTTFNGTSWSTDTRLPAHASSVGPALAVYGGKLHLVHCGGGGDKRLWHATFNGTSWSADTHLPAHSTAANPALAVYGDKLHLVHRGAGSDTSLWHATYNGTSWSADTQLRASSLEGPGLAVLDGKLYCVHRGYGGGDQNLWWSYYNGSSWSTDQMFPGHSSGAGPAVIAYRDKNGTRNQLLVVHRGYGKRMAGTDAAEAEARIAAEQATSVEKAND